MELKLKTVTKMLSGENLLIVPYGIETSLYIQYIMMLKLLIVPYGIETSYHWSLAAACILLIVPYGIETMGIHFTLEHLLKHLLIVPYGIETYFFL